MTLTPGGGRTTRIVSLCVLCGSRGTADALLNLVLFVPLGLLIGARRGATAALLAGVFVSAGVEVGQLLLPGRFSNVGDLLWNGLGAGLGGWLSPVLREWLTRPVPAARRVAVGLPLLWLLSAGLLLRPLQGTLPYTVDHLDDAERPRIYDDWSAAARLARAMRPQTGDAGAAHLDLAPHGAWELAGRSVEEEATPRLAPIAGVYDAHDRPIRIIGADRDDVVLWERTAAPLLGFDYASMHLRGELARYDVGDTLHVVASSSGRKSVCLSVESVSRCAPRITPERTWTLLRSREHASPIFKGATDVLWMATLTLLIGLLGGRIPATLISGAAFLVLLTLIAWPTALSPPGVVAVLGVALGIGAGAGLRPLARSFLVSDH